MKISQPLSVPVLFCLLLTITACVGPASHHAFVQNVAPRRDTQGEIIDAHDGCLQYFSGRYYLYGTAYGRSAGFGINNRFRVYSSADLEHWNFDGELIEDQPLGVFFRPYIVFNPTTKKYVLWFNWYPKLWDGLVGAAVSDTPTGPFRMVSRNVRLSQSKSAPGDGSLFVDDDGTGYFIYTVIGQGHAIRIERLTPDFLGSTGEASEVLGTGSEAPTLFRRGKTYYALFDLCSCFGIDGSGARVLTATSPLGPYVFRSNINRDSTGTPIIAAQQTYVARLPGPEGDVYMWMGDRWGSRPDGIKGHDLQYWASPLRFLPDGSIAPLQVDLTWSGYFLRGKDRPPIANPNFLAKRKDPNPLKIDPCSGQAIPPEAQDTGEAP